MASTGPILGLWSDVGLGAEDLSARLTIDSDPGIPFPTDGTIKRVLTPAESAKADPELTMVPL
jgi:hypothetical protein